MPRILRVLAPNPGPFTLEGTNTWIVGTDPGLVIDPGPDDPEHVAAVAREAGAVEAILLSHRHPDHAPGAARLAAATGAVVRAFRPELEEKPLRDGDVVRAGDVELTVVHTPGHTPDHLVFLEARSGALFTGDAVLGRGTSVIDPPEGDLATYLRSLETMRRLEPRVLYPGHGPAVWEGVAKLEEYMEHRRLRERQVLDGLRGGPRSPEELVPDIYGEYPAELYPAAARSVLAHLLKLESQGRVARVIAKSGEAGTDRFELASPSA
jgi:glyoxylase-like metal-dependent hydrolase (beta-lactamase superfamily II)